MILSQTKSWFGMLLKHTRQRLIFFFMFSRLKTPPSGLENCLSSSGTEASQKLNLSVNTWHDPRAPLHSMNGVALKSSRQLPGLDRDWPPPSAPAAVCCKSQVKDENVLVEGPVSGTYHGKTESCPKRCPTVRTVRFLSGLTVNRHHVCRSFADRASTDELLDLSILNWF